MLCKSGHARRVPDLMRVDFERVDLERLNQPENAPLDQKLPEMGSLQGVHCLRKNCLSITILSIKPHGYLSEICGGFCFQLVANLLKRPCSDKLKWVLTRMVTIQQIYIYAWHFECIGGDLDIVTVTLNVQVTFGDAPLVPCCI